MRPTSSAKIRTHQRGNSSCRPRCRRGCYALVVLLGALLPCNMVHSVTAQSGQDNSQTTAASVDSSDKQPAHFRAFAERLSGAALVGHFTVSGTDLEKPLQEERYEISSVTKMGNSDYWLFKARIKYGDHDVTVPMPLQVKWAGETPVITLDHVSIPKLGTFDARVVIDGVRYAGTWQHDDIGGHLFGRIERLEKGPAAKEEEEEEAESP